MSSDGCHKARVSANELRSRLSTKSGVFVLCYILLEIISGLVLASHPHWITAGFRRPLPSVVVPATTKQQFDIKSEETSVVELPPLEELITENGTVIGDISWMLDFSIIAFPKAGTTFLKEYLNSTEETFVYEREFCMKHYSDVTDFVKKYHALHVKYDQPRYPKTMKFGLKCPGVFYRADDIHFYAKYFPNTKFIIGLRHPVSWFESFYNYQSYRNISLPKTSQLIGRCTKHQKVCTDRARVHAALARLGKTPMIDDEEISLLYGLSTRHDHDQHQHQQRQRRRRIQQTTTSNVQRIYSGQQHSSRQLRKQQNGMALPNKVFLYEVRQIHDEEASKELSSRLSQFLGIQGNFPPIESSYKQNKTRAIDICDEEHDEVRRVLVDIGIDAATWAQAYFLKSPSSSRVEVTSRESFHRFLGDWSVDPCSSSNDDRLHKFL